MAPLAPKGQARDSSASAQSQGGSQCSGQHLRARASSRRVQHAGKENQPGSKRKDVTINIDRRGKRVQIGSTTVDIFIPSLRCSGLQPSQQEACEPGVPETIQSAACVVSGAIASTSSAQTKQPVQVAFGQRE